MLIYPIPRYVWLRLVWIQMFCISRLAFLCFTFYWYFQIIFLTSFGRGRSQGICWICDLEVLKAIWLHSTTDVSYFRPYAETKNDGSEREVCMKWIQFRSSFRLFEAASFIIQTFSRCFSLSFNVLVDVMRMVLSCSMIMIFPWLLKSWSCLLKCLQTGIGLGFLTSFL